jgi:hypothetical protein
VGHNVINLAFKGMVQSIDVYTSHKHAADLGMVDTGCHNFPGIVGQLFLKISSKGSSFVCWSMLTPLTIAQYTLW